MSRFSRDIATVLEEAGLATYATDMWTGANAVLPQDDGSNGPYTTIVDTGGPAPLRTHDAEHQRPTAQVSVRAADLDTAWALATQHRDALVGTTGTTGVRNRLINGVRYREISLLGELADIGPDQNGRAMVAFNVIGDKRPG